MVGLAPGDHDNHFCPFEALQNTVSGLSYEQNIRNIRNISSKYYAHSCTLSLEVITIIFQPFQVDIMHNKAKYPNHPLLARLLHCATYICSYKKIIINNVNRLVFSGDCT